MGASVCKKCKRAYPKYLERCPSCNGAPRKSRREADQSRRESQKPVTESVMEPVTVTTPVTDTKIEYGASPNGLVPGEPCPLCGKRVGRDAKQRQREWRARQQ